MAKPLAVTCGDPAGIGPEVVLKALAVTRADAVVYGPVALFEKRAAELDLPLPKVEACGEGAEWTPSPESGRLALASIDRGTAEVLEGRAGALVTAPVSKKLVHDSGTPFLGHTEYLAAKAGVRHTTMMFHSAPLKVSLATTHLALRDVAARLSPEGVARTILHTLKAMRDWFGVGSPRIAVAGLNPHAGEGGLVGREEGEVVEPGMAMAREEGADCRGPLSGDSVFRRAMSGEFDAVVAMYHDQGLAAVKSVAPGAVNVTLGLPFIRTSPDHGTGFEIAGRGIADPEAMKAAVKLASEILSRQGSLV